MLVLMCVVTVLCYQCISMLMLDRMLFRSSSCPAFLSIQLLVLVNLLGPGKHLHSQAAPVEGFVCVEFCLPAVDWARKGWPKDRSRLGGHRSWRPSQFGCRKAVAGRPKSGRTSGTPNAVRLAEVVQDARSGRVRSVRRR